MTDFEYNNESEDTNIIVELNSSQEDTLYDEDVIKEPETDVKKTKKLKVKKAKKDKEFFWKKLSKKTKIIIIVSVIGVALIITGLLLYFLVFKKDKVLTPPENIVIQKDNYIFENGTLKLLDNNDKIIGNYKCIDNNVDKCYIARLSNEDTFDTPRYVDEKNAPLEKKSKIYNNRFVFIYDDEKIVLYDIQNESTSGEYQLIKDGNIEKDLIVAKDTKDKYGLIEIKASETNTLLDFEYEYLGIINDENRFVVKDGAYSFLIDASGKLLTSKVRGDIKSFSDKYLSVYETDYSLYDYTGAMVKTDKYDYIDFQSNYLFIIKNSKMFILDNTLFKLNEVGINVRANNYNKTYVFDEKNNLKETKKPYTIAFTTGKITITYNDKVNTVVNIYESVLNKTSDYVNYYDGILYFYNDLEKTNLLGSYTCTNKNNIASDKSTYDNCYISKDTNLINNVEKLGFTPIYNGNYAFIKDTKTDSLTPTIILYDIKNSSQKAKYQAVDTGASSEKVTSITSLNSLIMAKNTEGNLGMITFGTDGPSGVIAFKENEVGTSKIKYLKDYILVQRSNKYYLYDKIGNIIASSSFEIKDYLSQYMLVFNNNYLVYKMSSSDSGKILSNELKHVELLNNIYVGIDKDYKLNVYNYDETKTGLIEDSLEILVKDKLSDSYKISINNSSYTISILQADKTYIDYKYNMDWSLVSDGEE